jgi:hypothetical protein
MAMTYDYKTRKITRDWLTARNTNRRTSPTIGAGGI